MIAAELAYHYGWTFNEIFEMKAKELEIAQSYMRKNSEGGKGGKRH